VAAWVIVMLPPSAALTATVILKFAKNLGLRVDALKVNP
jgi:hypothetical protein